MSALNLEDIGNFTQATLDKYDYKKWEDISLPLRDYEFMSRMLNKKPERGGPRLKWKVRLNNTQNARVVGLYQPDQTNVEDTLTEASVTWSHQNNNVSYDVREEEFQSGPEMIIDLIQEKIHDLYNGFAELMEELMWTAPPAQGLKPNPVLGIPWWFVRNSAQGFNGGLPSGFTDVAGIDPTIARNRRWKNWTDTYKAVTRDDLVEKTVKALNFTNFKPPHQFPSISMGPPKHMIYTTYAVESQLKRLQTQQNENLGPDVGWYEGALTINKAVVKSVAAFDDPEHPGYDTTNPVYLVNWNKFGWFFQKNNNMKRRPPEKSPTCHLVFTVHLDNSGNFRCINRREAGAVLYQSA